VKTNLQIEAAFLKVGSVALIPLLALPFSAAPMAISVILFMCLWVLTIYDWVTFRLPNTITAAFFISGLLYIYTYVPSQLVDHLIGAVAGLFFFPLLNALYKALRGRDGVGLGDAKLLAGIGVWLGWAALPLVLLIGSLAGLAYAFYLYLTKNDTIAMTKLPFGPFLSLGCWVSWLYL
tara:strand:+ start:932 stop:1465 length:534 start_codon:yes stop_codon:yes gene_type:complete